MDQVRTALAWLKKHHFWVLSALIPLIMIFCWNKASGKMSALYSKNESEIKGGFTSVDKVKGDPFHPNEDVNTKQEAQTKQQAEDVAKLWQQLYDRQRQHVLEWPVQLSKEFRDAVEKLQFGADIPWDLRNHYQNYIENHFPDLPKQIEARAIDETVTGTGGPGGGEMMRSRSFTEMPTTGPNGELIDDNDYICEWVAADQAIIRDELKFPLRPSALRIWVTQEDIWVYHTLLDVIAKTNKAANATRMSNAAVQVVGELAVGHRAGQFNRQGSRLWVQPSVQAVAGAPGEAGPGGMVGPEGGPGPGPGGERPGGMAEFSPERMGQPGQEMTEEQERTMLLYGRYLGPDGKPVPYGSAGAAAPGGEPVPAEATPAAAPAGPLDLTVFGTEYKRLPVRMVLRMDQRWLPHLIAECASQPLQVEVQEVRINAPDALSGSGGPGGGGGGRGPGGMGGASQIFPDEQAFQAFPAEPEMVNVVIQGTIYIFNKPNPAALQSPGAQPAGEQATTPPAA
jgi:hypothetical protein